MAGGDAVVRIAGLVSASGGAAARRKLGVATGAVRVPRRDVVLRHAFNRQASIRHGNADDIARGATARVCHRSLRERDKSFQSISWWRWPRWRFGRPLVVIFMVETSVA
jgi:hypothetical protein